MGLTLRATFLIAFIVFPYATWYLYVLSVNDGFYVYESSAHNQVYWVFSALKGGALSFLDIWIGYARENLLAGLFSSGFSQLAVAVSVSILLKKRVCRAVFSDVWLELGSCVLTILLYLAFFATVGISAPRFGVVVAVPLSIAASVIVGSTTQHVVGGKRSLFLLFFCGSGLAALVATVLKDGPWS